MLYLFLPGNSKHNFDESKNILDALSAEGYETLLHAWRHWENEKHTLDYDIEIENILKEIDGKDVFIISKSLGTYVAALLIPKIRDSVKGVILMGVNTHNISPDKIEIFQKAFKEIDKLFVIQNTNDPWGNLEGVSKLLEGIEYQVIEKEADTHDYNYSEEVLKIIQNIK